MKDTDKDKCEKKSDPHALKHQFSFARAGLAVGAAALFASTAYMNVSGWVAQADDTTQALANGLLASGFELMALCGLSWAGFQYAKGRKSAAMLAAAIAVAAIAFNTLAAQNFLHLQAEDLSNAIETSSQTVQVNTAEIDALQAEIDSLIVQNKGKIPRPVEAVEAAYGDLDPERHQRRIARRDSEIALRTEYERLQGRITELRRDASSAAVSANDSGRTVIPTAMLGPFVWVLEIIKGTIFFALGTASGKQPQTSEVRRMWAIIKGGDTEEGVVSSSDLKRGLSPHVSNRRRRPTSKSIPRSHKPKARSNVTKKTQKPKAHTPRL
ncbi:MAG: hypothetical protein AAF224_09500 [Pseudomonadota bacterium]